MCNFINYIMICTFTLSQIDTTYIYTHTHTHTFHILVIITGYYDNTFDRINIYCVINYINYAHLHVIILTHTVHTHTHTHIYIYIYSPYCYKCYGFYHDNINIKLRTLLYFNLSCVLHCLFQETKHDIVPVPGRPTEESINGDSD